ncbi:MAG TPA: TetR family transcriptional regulator [Anaerolineales bacterium]|nr:TetR family transcriptional regulator [Anaerolineales bacterium]
MRRTKEEAEITRQNLLATALQVFSRQGYAETRLEDIAAEAKVTRGAIYHHFGSKADLYNAMVTEASGRALEVLQKAISAGGNTLDALKRVFVDLLTYAQDDSRFRAINELVIFKTGSAPELQEGFQRKIAGNRQMVDFFAAKIRAGIEAGEIRSDVNPKDAALTLIALNNGLLSLWLLDPDLFKLKQRAAALADIFIQGIAVL